MIDILEVFVCIQVHDRLNHDLIII